MNRRAFLKLSAATVVGSLLPFPRRDSMAQGIKPHHLFDDYFLTITRGFLKNALASGRDFVTCDFPEGTKLKTCCTSSGKTYTSVSRMLPAIAEFVAARPTESKI